METEDISQGTINNRQILEEKQELWHNQNVYMDNQLNEDDNEAHNERTTQWNEHNLNMNKLIESPDTQNARTYSKEDIWFNDIGLLFDPQRLFIIVPTKNMSLGGKVNAVTRFTLYLSIILSVVKQNYLYIYVFIVPVIISYIMFIFSSKNKEYFNILESDTSTNAEIHNELSDDNLNTIMQDALIEDCKKPTPDNPTMNLLPTDNFQQVKPACNITNPQISNTISQEISDCLSDKLYNDTTSIFNVKANERTFYTMPNTGVPNDQGAFAKWLYSTPVSCTIGNNGLLKQMRSCSLDSKTLGELNKEVNPSKCVPKSKEV